MRFILTGVAFFIALVLTSMLTGCGGYSGLVKVADVQSSKVVWLDQVPDNCGSKSAAPTRACQAAQPPVCTRKMKIIV